MRPAPASAMMIELSWLDTCATGFIKLRVSVKNDAMAPSVNVSKPVSPRLGVPAMAM